MLEYLSGAYIFDSISKYMHLGTLICSFVLPELSPRPSSLLGGYKQPRFNVVARIRQGRWSLSCLSITFCLERRFLSRNRK